MVKIMTVQLSAGFRLNEKFNSYKDSSCLNRTVNHYLIKYSAE